MTGCSLHNHFSMLLSLMGSEDTFSLSHESLARLLEQHTAKTCCTSPAEPPKPQTGSSMGYTTAEIAETMGVSSATAGRYIRAGWFGDPKGLQPNGAHYRIPHHVAEDVFTNGPLCEREPGDTAVAASTASPKGRRTQDPARGDVAEEAEVEEEVSFDPNETSTMPDEDHEVKSEVISPDAVVLTEAVAKKAAVANRGAPDDGTETEDLRALFATEPEEPVDPMMAALGDWEEVYRVE